METNWSTKKLPRKRKSETPNTTLAPKIQKKMSQKWQILLNRGGTQEEKIKSPKFQKAIFNRTEVYPLLLCLRKHYSMRLNVLLQCTLMNCLWYCNDAENDRLITELKMLPDLACGLI